MRTLLLVLTLALSASVAGAQEANHANPNGPPPVRHPADNGLTAPGRPVGHVDQGDRAPDFELESADGPRVRLSNLRGGWVALCFCGRGEALGDADSLSRSLPGLRFTVVAVSGQRLSALRKWARLRGSHIVLLSDPTNEIAALYGAIDPDHDIPRPSFILVDPTGVVHTSNLGRRTPPGEAMRIVQYAVTGS